MGGSDYKVELCTTAAQLRGACQVRIEVFVKEQGYDIKDEIDQYDPLAAHFVLVHKSDPDRVLGTLRLLPYPLPIPKPDYKHSEFDPHSAYPLGGCRTESVIAGDFISAVRSSHPMPLTGSLDVSQTAAEERQATVQVPEVGGAKLGRLALLKEVRGKKLGSMLVREVEDWLFRLLTDDVAKQNGAFGPPASVADTNQIDNKNAKTTDEESTGSIIIKLSSQIYALGFYRKLGYLAVGEEYDEDGEAHKLCYKQVFLAQMRSIIHPQSNRCYNRNCDFRSGACS